MSFIPFVLVLCIVRSFQVHLVYLGKTFLYFLRKKITLVHGSVVPHKVWCLPFRKQTCCSIKVLFLFIFYANQGFIYIAIISPRTIIIQFQNTQRSYPMIINLYNIMDVPSLHCNQTFLYIEATRKLSNKDSIVSDNMVIIPNHLWTLFQTSRAIGYNTKWWFFDYKKSIQ
jgi:hypothetical protein